MPANTIAPAVEAINERLERATAEYYHGDEAADAAPAHDRVPRLNYYDVTSMVRDNILSRAEARRWLVRQYPELVDLELDAN